MKRGIGTLVIVGGLLGAFALGRAGAQEGPVDPMAAWAELAKTGPQHAALKSQVGTWTCESKCWCEPGKEPTVEQGKVTYSMVLGDRFLRQEVEGAMMGQPFHGLGYTGFDNATKKYQAVWMDSMGTCMMLMTGTEIKPGVQELKGSFAGPGGAEMKMRIIHTKVSDDKMTMDMFCDMGMGEMKSMEQTYTRSK
jgi:hypothetical protein